MIIRIRNMAVKGLLFLALTTSSLQGAEVQLKQRAHVKHAIVTLGDVADIFATSSRESSLLKKMELFPTPPRGGKRLVRAGEIQDFLALQGANLLELRFSGSSQITVVAASPNDRRKKQVKQPVSKVAVTQPTEVVVATRELQRGIVIKRSDVKLDHDQKKISGKTEPFLRIQDVLGKETKRRIPFGRRIDRNDVQRQILVRRGDLVRVSARSRGVQVKTTAKAREEGSLGDLVWVESLANRKRYAARISGFQEVEVITHAPSAIKRKTATSERKTIAPR